MPKSILIVDDHEVVRRELRSLFKPYPEFSICGEAVHGVDAIEKAGELSPDLIILDLAMPEMNGLEAARILRGMMPKIPILMYTSFATSNLAEEAKAAGVSRVSTQSTPPALIEDLQLLLKNTA